MIDSFDLPEDVLDGDTTPRRTRTLAVRRASLADPRSQIELLASLELPVFEARLVAAGTPVLNPTTLEYFQINVGKLCNMTCRHCHVDAGPDRVTENMDRATIDACLAALDQTGAHTVDITGGAPELNPHFRYLVEACVERGKHVIDRCNLTVLLLPRYRDLPTWLGERGVEVVCSLPHYRRPNTDAQRGEGVFARSIEALTALNAAGYGKGDPARRLTLMHNPAGAFLPGAQASMEREWKVGLLEHHGVGFDRLIALNNMPISRYLEWLEDSGNLEAYMRKLTAAFNPAAVSGVMCRNTISIGWDGAIYDCDFNQMLELPVASPVGNVRDVEFSVLQNRQIVTGQHCYGCTAGAGSSCGGQ